MKIFAKLPIIVNCSSTNKQNNNKSYISDKPKEAFTTKSSEINKSIFKNMDEINKKEMTRIKVLFNDNMDYFKEKKVPIILSKQCADQKIEVPELPDVEGNN